MLTFIIITDKTFLSICAVGLIFAHELGHIILARILNVPIREINFGAMSIDICKSQIYYEKSFLKKIFLVLGGCIFNFCIYLVLYMIYLATRKIIFMYISVQSLCIGIINILPIESLDGGEVVNLILHRFFGYESAKRISNVISIIFLVPIIFLGIFLVIKSWHNMSVIMLAIYLIFEKYFYV